MTKYIVREATADDLQECLLMSVDFMKATPFANRPVCLESLSTIFFMSVEHGLGFVAESDGHIFGMLIGCKSPAFFDHKLTVATEMGWWVDDEYRNTKAPSMLLNAFEEEAGRTCDYTVMSVLSTSPPQLVDYLQYRGYKENERLFCKENT